MAERAQQRADRQRSPAQEDLNGLFLTITQQLAYILSSGIPEWDSTTTYYIGQFVRVGGVLYVSIADSNVGNVVTNTNKWVPYTKSMRVDRRVGCGRPGRCLTASTSPRRVTPA
jgi:hypothetical protein